MSLTPCHSTRPPVLVQLPAGTEFSSHLIWLPNICFHFSLYVFFQPPSCVISHIDVFIAAPWCQHKLKLFHSPPLITNLQVLESHNAAADGENPKLKLNVASSINRICLHVRLTSFCKCVSVWCLEKLVGKKNSQCKSNSQNIANFRRRMPDPSNTSQCCFLYQNL